MTTRYRVEYALKTHRRDQLIEWIKGLLAVPFVLHSQPTAAYASTSPTTPNDDTSLLSTMATTTHRRYAEILRDVEALITDHLNHQVHHFPGLSKLKHLVPTTGTFFTPLPLEKAFVYQDRKRRISSRRFVAPSFNDVRAILNTAQLMALVHPSPSHTPSHDTTSDPISNPTRISQRQETWDRAVTGVGGLKLITFDGDLTLYPDGSALDKSNPVIHKILALLARGIHIGIVTAAGYTEPAAYHARLHGLLNAIDTAIRFSAPPDDPVGSLNNVRSGKTKLVVMGGESNYLFIFDGNKKALLSRVEREEWMLPEMRGWTEPAISSLLDVAEGALRECIINLSLPATIFRKERAVGIIPRRGGAFTREQLEETVLVTQQVVEMSQAESEEGRRVPFCAFNGGNDVFVDIGDKSLGVRAVQNWIGTREEGQGGIKGEETLHIGDQFLSAGANDFKAEEVELAERTFKRQNSGEWLGIGPLS
ncbi:uncharacterized protein KY384_005644 [Bacidia gigantensis]|uniref:uncharacterized protein n=1 Tax=Bacidia gigantensis TaxID=2732470 RepID=UPI001D052B59|nr:uncharacterized protein KY384_005644 [Bacidia gigantensis]KAG8530161.1 hypothetical protein KY384_005644 [Bacidia gigantensis]